jgi:uncharacterized protein (TIGR03382 family)
MKSFATSVVLALCLSVFPSAAEACSRMAQESVQGLEVLPADGTTVPRSTRLWVYLGNNSVHPPNGGALRVVDGAGAVVPTDEQVITVTGEVDASLVILTPRAPLPGQARYELQAGTTRLSSFTTSDEIDTVAPEVPTVTVGAVEGEYFGLQSCGNSTRVSLTLGMPAEVALLLAAPPTSGEVITRAMAAGAGSNLTAYNTPAGALTLTVLAFDLSGNRAEATDVLTVTVPEKQSGCSATSAGPALVLALLVLRRRRSLQPGVPV